MAGSINKVILVGNVGQDPEIRTTQDGKEIANFSLATTDSWRDKTTGERQSRTEWHRVVIFNTGLVSVVKNYVRKGAKLYIEGALQTRKWTDPSTNSDRYSTEIVLQGFNSTLTMLDSRSEGGSFQQSSPANAAFDGPGNAMDPAAAPTGKAPDFKNDELEDEIPF